MLRAHKHLTKKELKKDPLLILIAQVTDFLQREWMKIASVVFGVLLVVVVSLLFVRGSRRSDITAYDRALQAYTSNAPEAIDMMAQYAQNHSGSKRAVRVLLQLGNYYVTQKNYTAAEQYYLECTKKAGDDIIFSYNAYNGLGAVYEEQGQFDTAAKTYADFLKAHAKSPFTGIMQFNAGKAYYLAGDSTAAKQYFTALTDAPEDSELKQEARYYLELLS